MIVFTACQIRNSAAENIFMAYSNSCFCVTFCMQFGKSTLFFALNGLVGLILLLYFAFWLFCSTVNGTIKRPLQANRMVVKYEVDNVVYTKPFMRNGYPFAERSVGVRYWGPNPNVARINSFLGFVAEPLAWWLLFFIASAMLLLTNNTVFSKGTRFQLHKGFPWITMDEFFPAGNVQQHRQGGSGPKNPS